MKTKLKYLKLFEGVSPKDIPHSSHYNKHIIDKYIFIKTPRKLTELPEIYNELTDEITGHISISDATNLTHINNFKNLTTVGEYLSINNNHRLTYITGFNNLISVKGVDIIDNHKLISMSIPYKLIKSTYYKYGNSICSNPPNPNNQNHYLRFQSPKKFINYIDIIQECIDRFDPAIHPDIVVKQIIENLELWGEPYTITTIINHILSKGDYLNLIPEPMNQYVDDHYHHLYNAKYAKTGARGIAKMNTGRYLGMF